MGVGHIQGPRSVSAKSHMIHLPLVLSSIWPPKGGLQWLDSRGRFASRTAILFERGALLVDVEVCLPDLESEDLSNRIAVLELESDDLSNRIAALAS